MTRVVLVVPRVGGLGRGGGGGGVGGGDKRRGGWGGWVGGMVEGGSDLTAPCLQLFSPRSDCSCNKGGNPGPEKREKVQERERDTQSFEEPHPVQTCAAPLISA